MFKARKSLDNGIVHIVLSKSMNVDAVVLGVFSTIREAKCHIITHAFKTINVEHYNPSDRFYKLRDMYSLSKDAPIYWEDVWKHSVGIHDYYIHSWHVDTQKYDTLHCILDTYIKHQIASNTLSWSKVRELLEKWRSMSNYESFYDTCFSEKSSSWFDDVDEQKWITKFEEKEYVDTAKPKVLSRHMSMMKRVDVNNPA